MSNIETLFNKVSFTNWRAFWISFTIVLVGVSLNLLHINLPHISRFLPEEVISPFSLEYTIFDSIKGKLESKKNNFIVKGKQSLVSQSFAAQEYDNLSAYGVVNFDTGEVILEKNISDRLPIASITKIMTAVVALDLASENELFEISEYAANRTPTKVGVPAGQRMSMNELLHALLLTSANDSAEVIKEGINKKYGEDIFMKSMNYKAQVLGLKNSHFMNPQGFDNADHYSSVEDLATLTKYALTQYPLIAEIVKKEYVFFPANQYHRQIDLYNWNGLLGVYPGTVGMKIGNTGDAGYTTVVVSEREGHTLIGIGLGAPGVLERDLWMSQLLDSSFERQFDLLPINIAPYQLQQKYASWKYWN